MSRDDKGFRAEVSCGPGIVLALQTFLECGLCSVSIRGRERCDQSGDDLTGSCKKGLKSEGHIGSSKSGRRRLLRGDDSLEVNTPAEMERRQEHEASPLEWKGGCFQSNEF